MKKYLCRVYSSHEYAPVDYAYVELDDELQQFLSAVVPLIQGLKAVRGETFLRTEFLHYQPEFLEGLPDEFEEYEDALNCGDLVELPLDAKAPEGNVRLDFATIQVEDDGFRWTCRAKHSPCEHETVTFNFKDVGWPELDLRERP